jgi:hypothetical protein
VKRHRGGRYRLERALGDQDACGRADPDPTSGGDRRDELAALGVPVDLRGAEGADLRGADLLAGHEEGDALAGEAADVLDLDLELTPPGLALDVAEPFAAGNALAALSTIRAPSPPAASTAGTETASTNAAAASRMVMRFISRPPMCRRTVLRTYGEAVQALPKRVQRFRRRSVKPW